MSYIRKYFVCKGKGKGKGKGPFYLTSVVPSVLQLRETAINGSRRCALYPPCHCQCSVLRVFKAIATRIRGKSKQTLKSLKIEPGTSRSESRALAYWATTAPVLFNEGRTGVFSWCMISSFYFLWNVNLGNYSLWPEGFAWPMKNQNS